MEEDKFLDLLKKELVVSIGCTEPVAIAFAAALARKYVIGKEIKMIRINASRNVIKNAMSVGIPGTGSCGIKFAAAIGTFSNSQNINFELLSYLKPGVLENALNMIKRRLVMVRLADSMKKLFIEVVIETEKSYSRVIIEDQHDNVVLVEVDGEKIDNYHRNGDLTRINENSNDVKLDFLNLDSILEFIQKVEVKKLNLVKETIKMNKMICLEGLIKPYGLKVGMSIKSQMERGFLANDTANYATALTAAGSDARMAGSKLPVMTNSGSGNQGISATIPIVAFAENLNSCKDELIRAVALSNLVTIYIKSNLGRLSPLCGATISATGACCGIIYLMDGEDKIKSSIQNIMGNITGMICDGAKAGCALKVATCTTAAIQSAIITIEGNTINASDGIIEKNPEDTIKNFCKLGNVGMKKADQIILDMMLKKNNSIVTDN